MSSGAADIGVKADCIASAGGSPAYYPRIETCRQLREKHLKSESGLAWC